MRRIRSRHFQIFGKDEYWRILYVKVSSCNYSSIYARMSTNFGIRLFLPILRELAYVRFCLTKGIDERADYNPYRQPVCDYSSSSKQDRNIACCKSYGKLKQHIHINKAPYTCLRCRSLFSKSKIS